jgi:hypothetical protein
MRATDGLSGLSSDFDLHTALSDRARLYVPGSSTASALGSTTSTATTTTIPKQPNPAPTAARSQNNNSKPDGASADAGAHTAVAAMTDSKHTSSDRNHPSNNNSATNLTTLAPSTVTMSSPQSSQTFGPVPPQRFTLGGGSGSSATTAMTTSTALEAPLMSSGVPAPLGLTASTDAASTNTSALAAATLSP